MTKNYLTGYGSGHSRICGMTAASISITLPGRVTPMALVEHRGQLLMEKNTSPWPYYLLLTVGETESTPVITAGKLSRFLRPVCIREKMEKKVIQCGIRRTS